MSYDQVNMSLIHFRIILVKSRSGSLRKMIRCCANLYRQRSLQKSDLELLAPAIPKLGYF